MVCEYLENLKNSNKLNNYVIDYYLKNDYESIDDVINDMEDLQRYGCISGMINDLIYYDDTNRFYEDYKEDINYLLSDVLSGTGYSIDELFGDKFDKEDPLIMEYSNKNLLAWFGFEETAYRIYEEIKEKLKYSNFNYEC